MPRSTQLCKERIATSTPECQAGVLVVRRHHLLVRCSHWLNASPGPPSEGLLGSGSTGSILAASTRHAP